MTSNGCKAGYLLAAVILIALPLGILAASDVYFVDDAYISLRYARNLADGDGLVWNAGQRVEGITNFLWTVLLTGALWLGCPAELTASWLGVGFAMLAVLLGWRLAARLTQSRWAGWLAAVTVAALPDFWRTAAGGLESGLFSFLLVWFAWLLLQHRPGWKIGLVGGLLFLTRPESGYLLPIAITYLWFTGNHAPANTTADPAGDTQPTVQRQPAGDSDRPALPWSKLFRMCLVWLFIVAGMECFRLWYFGQWLPNSVIAKGLPLHETQLVGAAIRNGVKYTLGFFLAAPLLPLAVFLAAVLRSPRRSAGRFLLAVLAILTVIILRNGGDWMPTYRLFMMYAPLLGLAVAIVLQCCRPAGRVWVGIVVIVLTSAISFVQAGQWTTQLSLRTQVPPNEKPYHVVATAIREELPADIVITAEAVGATGWLLPNHTIHDPMGLTDFHIARNGRLSPTFGRWNLDYTTNTVKPAVYFSHYLPRLDELRQAYKGDFDHEYVIFTLPYISQAAESPTQLWFAAIRRDLLPSIEPSLRQAGCRRNR